MKKYIYSISFLTVAILVGGCAQKPEVLQKEAAKRLQKQDAYKRLIRTKHNKEQMLQRIALSKRVKAYFYNKPVYDAIKEIAYSYNLDFDRGFVPSRSDYKITTNFEGSLKDFLDEVYRDTGVKYEYIRNMLQVTNKKLVVEDIMKKECSTDSMITIKLRRDNPNEVLAYFANKYGYNFVTNFKLGGEAILAGAPEDMSPNSSIKRDAQQIFGAQGYNDMFVYKGCDPEEAFYMYLKTKNLTAKKLKKNFYEIRDYKELSFSYPMFFNQYDFKSGVNLGSITQSDSQNFKAVAGEDMFKTIESLIRQNMSQAGKFSFTNRGLVSVLDTPNNIDSIKKVFNKEIAKQYPFKLYVVILRIDKNDNTDVNTMIMKVFSRIGIEMPYFRQSDGVTVFDADNPNVAVKLLQETLDAEVVREYQTTTRAGKLTSFKAVDIIPYVTTSLVVNQGTATTTAEGKFAEAGLILNVLPTIERKTNTLDYSIDIIVSEYLGDKTITFQGGTYTLPKFNSNEVQTEAVSHLGESIILTGFRLKNWSNMKEGVPTLSQNNMFGWLFGGKKNSSKYSDFIIIISSKPLSS